MTGLNLSQLNRAITSGTEGGIFVLPKGPSGKVKLASKAKPLTSGSKEASQFHVSYPYLILISLQNSKPLSKVKTTTTTKKAAAPPPPIKKAAAAPKKALAGKAKSTTTKTKKTAAPSKRGAAKKVRDVWIRLM